MTDPFAYRAPGLIKTVRSTNRSSTGAAHAFAGQDFLPPGEVRTQCGRAIKTANALIENSPTNQVSCRSCYKAIQPYYGTSFGASAARTHLEALARSTEAGSLVVGG